MASKVFTLFVVWKCDKKLYQGATRSYETYCLDAILSVWDNPTKT